MKDEDKTSAAPSPGEIADLVIIGAGPAGLGAAITARREGLSVVVIDDQFEPGGQIRRAAGGVSEAHAKMLGDEYLLGRRRVKEFLESGATYFAEHSVWHIETDDDPPLVHCVGPQGARRIRGRRLVLATGAVERPTPVPGWTLPGVMTAGGLQILLKTSGLVGDQVVLAGAGPLLWLLASQMVAFGHPPKAVVESVRFRSYLRGARRLPGAMGHRKPLLKGLGYINKVRRAGVPIYRGAQVLRIEGDTRARALAFRDWRGRERRIVSDMIGLHSGVVPNPPAARLLRLEHRWDAAQHAFSPVRDGELRATGRVFIAGDGARIGGAEVAWLEGVLVGRAVAGKDVSALRRDIARARAVRPFLDALYRPGRDLRIPADATMVCRCEAVTAGGIRQAVRDGAMGPNQVKFLLRPGMGPCQGRVCGLAVSEIIADALGADMDHAGYYRIARH